MASADPLMAHVAPAADANNRYLRITPMRDRVRLAYTVYIGELPGMQARPRMDRNRDGQLSDDESKEYGQELGEQVLRALDITVDGAPYAFAWSEIHVGLGLPTTSAGSFSVDLIGWMCAADIESHEVVIFDRYRVPRPGDTEVKVQPSPGIEITRSSLGADEATSQLDLAWRGDDGPMATRGLYLGYTVDRKLADTPPGDACLRGPRADVLPRAKKRNWPAVLALLLLGAAALAAFVRARQKSGARAAQNTNG